MLVLAVLAAVVLLLRFLTMRAGSFLIVNDPQHSDVIVVLEGGGGLDRYAHANSLIRQGYSYRMLVDADVNREFYGNTEADLLMNYLRRIGAPAEICPTVGDSTYSETVDVQRCLARIGATSALIVTSDFHTRRALSIFQKRLPQYRWSVAAASAPYHNADQYWQHRAWAKSVLDEWEKFLWWKLVDQWRSDVVLH